MDPTILGPASALLGALVGGGASLVAAVYTQDRQNRLQRAAREVDKREAVYGDFVMSVSNVLLSAYVNDKIEVGRDEQHLIGLINRMRLFAPASVITQAEVVLKAIVEIALEPRVEPRQLAKEALKSNLDPAPLKTFSQIARVDLDSVWRTMA